MMLKSCDIETGCLCETWQQTGLFLMVMNVFAKFLLLKYAIKNKKWLDFIERCPC